MKILIVDDKPENLYLLELILKGSGYITASAKNGEEALDLARKDIPDLIISDILMPVMDGFTLCREFKKDENLCNVPFIFYTATYTDPKDEEFALNLGADKFILKPKEPDEFISIIEGVLKDLKKKNINAIHKPSMPDQIVFKEYNEALIRKLEDKMVQTEIAEKKVRKYNIALLREIEERKQAEELLQKSKRQISSIYDTVADSIFNLKMEKDGKYIFTSVNQCFLTTTGLQANQIIGKTVHEIIPEPSLTFVLEKYAEAIREKKIVRWEEISEYPSGKLVGDVSIAPLLDKNMNCIGLVGSVHNVTERKRAEEELKKANRIYAFLSNVNQAIIHAKNEETLFNEICRISVDIGKFKMAWIGIIDTQTNKINPVASNGFTQNYLKTINIDLSNEKLSQGPTGRAVKSGTHYLANDIDNNPEMKPWRENALRLGYKSSAAFPIRVFDKTLGAFMLYASEQHFFNETEVNLLDEVSMDISFALESIETERKRKEAEGAVIASEIKYRSFFENSMYAIFISEPDGKIISANPAASKLLGYSENGLIELGRSGIMDNTDPRLALLLSERRRNGNAQGELTMIRKDGTHFSVEISSAIFKSQDGLERTSMIIRDISERRLAEKKLHDSYERYKNLTDISPVGIFHTDVNGLTTFVNPTWCQISGLSAERALGYGWLDAVHPDDKEKLKIGWQESTKAQQVSYSDYRFLHRDGTIAYVMGQAVPEINSENQIVGYIGTITNITERKQSEESLAYQRYLMETLMNNIPDHIYFKDKFHRFIRVNKSQADRFGLSDQAQIFGKTDFDFFENEHAQKAYDDEEVIMQTGRSLINIEEKETWPDGHISWVSTTKMPLYDSNGRIIGTFGISRDITSRKLAEEEMTMLAHALKSINECVSITDLENNIIFVNESFLKTYGYSENELVGKNINIVRSQNNIPELVENILPATLQGGWQGELWNKRKDGSEFPINLSTKIITDKNGNPLDLIGVAIDITERKRTLKELIEAKENAEELNRLKSNFMANMSHELRTPLVGLLGISEFMKEELTGEYKENAAMIHDSGLRLLNTLTEILNFSKLESEKIVVTYSVINLTQLILDEIKLYQILAYQKGIAIIEYFSMEDFPIETDEKLLREIIDNLLNNAIKFTPAGTVTVSIEQTNDELTIKISDTGIGIPKDKFDIIFEEFRQVSEGISRNFEGNGLGLTIVKKYLQLLNGGIEIESEVGMGSTFIIRLPFTQTAQNRNVVEKLEILENEDKVLLNNKVYKVLIVEDDSINALTIERMLKNNFNIISVNSGLKAIEEVKKQAVDIILMDINLKHEISGIEATRLIRKIEGYEKIPIVAMTAYAMPSDREEFLENGCSHYIAKPFTKNEILQLLKEIFKQKQ
jgi:PAS domain S-box-containing protein